MKTFEIKNKSGKVIAKVKCAEGRNNLCCADMRGLNLTGANLAGANLTNANLSYADLSYANLADANLAEANLAGANLSYAVLAGANLTNANLTNENLTDANLAGADLSYANLAEANLAGANLIIAGVDERGYMFYATGNGESIQIRAGCRMFSSIKDARAHWQARHDGNLPLKAQCLAFVDTIESLAKVKGWIKETTS